MFTLYGTKVYSVSDSRIKNTKRLSILIPKDFHNNHEVLKMKAQGVKIKENDSSYNLQIYMSFDTKTKYSIIDTKFESDNFKEPVDVTLENIHGVIDCYNSNFFIIDLCPVNIVIMNDIKKSYQIPMAIKSSFYKL